MSSTELRVKELLRERGWTTKVLAEKTGMSEKVVLEIIREKDPLGEIQKGIIELKKRNWNF